jgi:hypothetical protein
MNYVTMSDEDKLRLLQEHCFDGSWPDLNHSKWCLHCEKTFTGHEARVWRDASGEHWLECGTRDCTGSPIDWADYPWWDENHPLTLTKAREKPRNGGMTFGS